MTIEHINSTSTLLRAAALLGAKYETKDKFQFLRLADGRSYQIVNRDEAWAFRPLWAVATSLVVSKETGPEDLKDLLLSDVVRIRGVVLVRGRRNE